MPVPKAKWKFITNIYRVNLDSNIGHRNRLLYMSLAFNETTPGTRNNCIDKMFCPCGTLPKPIILSKPVKNNEKWRLNLLIINSIIEFNLIIVKFKIGKTHNKLFTNFNNIFSIF